MGGRARARAIMIQGTGSDVGKSLLTAGLCRLFANRGLIVRPFKPQNMSNNAAVTSDGGEIGRAQALQALAARTPATVHMNPVLLKPQSETGAQIVVQGVVRGSARANAYQDIKPTLMPAVVESFGVLKEEADLVIVEGAGSASEINLRRNDIANMGFARECDVPVVLVGDIDRGGVIAQIVGTHAVLDDDDRRMVEGFIVNKMRGDTSLFADGMDMIAARTRWRNLGLVPFFAGAGVLPAEDALGLQGLAAGRNGTDRLHIAVPLTPHIANFDDLDPLRLEAEVVISLVKPGSPMPVCDVVLIAGSKATRSDLAFLRAQGWDGDIRTHRRRGGRILGICGGYQMLGHAIDDPDGIEGNPGESEGLGLLDVRTTMVGSKLLRAVNGSLLPEHAAFVGYEMHIGRTTGPDCARPLVTFDDGRVDGAMSGDGLVGGCYVHGLFGAPTARAAWLSRFGVDGSAISHDARVDAALDALAHHVERHVNVDALLAIAR
jgi:adenosylcobyric acid synthase